MRRKTKRRRMNPDMPVKAELADMAEHLWKTIIREQWGERCAICCGRYSLECHHLISKRHESTRYDVKNGMLLCKDCHVLNPRLSAHGNKSAFLQWLQDSFPDRRAWMTECSPRFSGTKNVLYYFEVIRGLMEFVEPEVYEKILTQEALRHVRETL